MFTRINYCAPSYSSAPSSSQPNFDITTPFPTDLVPNQSGNGNYTDLEIDFSLCICIGAFGCKIYIYISY